MTGFKVDPEALRRCALPFETAESSLRELAATVKTAVSAEGECWGGDKTGAQLGATLKPGQEAALKAMEDLPGNFRKIADSILRMADEFERGEGRNEEAIGSV
ncbi:hypothetical protein GCM10010191_44410 [Actinomadura vinacea]|uniref:WXG100 family type VII secretion target n=1 Tax=Actinomadura vinacea TaxID=115336 RepID=A0ABN3JCB7_9ACTN